MVTTAQELEFQMAQAGIRAAVEGRLTALMEQLARGGPDPRRFRDATIGATQLLVREFGQAAGDFAAEWYNDMRLTERVAGNFTATVATQSFDEAIEQTVRRAVAPLFTDSPDLAEVIRSVTVKAGQYTVDGARESVRVNSLRDPQSRGWKRVAHGATCDFCLMLVGRGGVYRESSVRFKSHARCNCGAVPSWDPSAPEVPSIAYQASATTSGMSDTKRAHLNSAVQGWIDDNRASLDELRGQLNVS